MKIPPSVRITCMLRALIRSCRISSKQQLISRRAMSFSIEERGSPNTLDYRVYYRRGDDNTACSPFHDIPLHGNSEKTVFNMVVEVPRWTNAKMEIAVGEPLNPIKQDIKKGKLRYVNNCFPYKGYIWNYGALPQTWEDPAHVDSHTTCKGDNDPLDVCEIGYKVAKRGEIKKVKVLGCLAMIDEGETDWKVMAIDVTDPLADKLNDIGDVEKEMPGFLAATRQWFKIYKMPTGKPPNNFAFNGEFKDKAFTQSIIDQTNEQWKKLIEKKTDAGSLNCSNTTCEGSPYRISTADAEDIVKKSPAPGLPAPIDPIVDQWHYVSA